MHTRFLRCPSEEVGAWRGEAGAAAPTGASPGGTSASQAWLNRVTLEEEERKRRGMDEEEEGRKRTVGGGGGEEQEDEGGAQKDVQDKVPQLFSQQPDPWAPTGVCALVCGRVGRWRRAEPQRLATEMTPAFTKNTNANAKATEIGRASCRERVCLYV